MVQQKNKKPVTHNIIKHQYPSLLYHYPILMQLIFIWNNIILQRNWHTNVLLKKNFEKRLPERIS